MPQATTTAERDADQVHDLPVQYRAATLIPATYNETDNTIELVWTTGSRRRAYDWYNDTAYEEELVVESEAVDMSRFEAGVVQALDNHRVYGGVQAILGIALRGWIENGEGRAIVRLSVRDEVAGIVADIRAGIIRSISFGYSVERYEITRAIDRTDGVNLPLYRAVRWTPQEISFVTVPADPNAGTRALGSQPERREGVDGGAATQGGMPCEFIRAAAHSNRGETPMPQPANPNQGGNTATPEQQQQQQQRQQQDSPAAQPQASIEQRADSQASAQAAADITDLCVRHGLAHLAGNLIRSGQGIDHARTQVLEELARRDAASGGHRNVRVETVQDEMQTRLDGISEAIMHRVNTRAQLTDNGRQYRGMSLLELGRDMLEGFGVKTRGLDRMELAKRMVQYRSGMHSTSDFANLLGNVAWKRLRGAYEENPGTYTRWARRAPNAPDFKNMSVVQMSAMPDLLQTNEHGEFKYGSLADGAETYALVTYGRIVSLSRQAIVNDDLRAFDRLLTGFGASAARLENRTVYAQLTANANLADGAALFNSTALGTAGGHANLASGAGSALQFSALSTARAAMRVQKGQQKEELNISPAFLIVPAALEQTAYQLTSSNYVPAKQADVNEFRQGGRTALEPVIEPILDANSASAWYLAANNSQVDTVEFCYLDGAEGVVLDTDLGFEVDGISFKGRLDFAAKAIDYRGLYKSAGA